MRQEKFINSSMGSYSGALHATFQKDMYDFVKAAPAADLTRWRIQPLMDTWAKHIAMEEEINREAQSSNDTRVLQAMDKQRDDLIMYILGLIRFENSYAILPTKKEAAQRLMRIVKTYQGLHREAYNEQTTLTAGMVNDLQKMQEFKDLKVLGLDALVGQLQQVNEEFRTAMQNRAANKMVQKLPTSREQRQWTDDVYKQVCDYLAGSFLFAENDAERERINHLVKLMNQRAKELKARHKQATSKGGSTTKPNGPNINPGSGVPRGDGSGNNPSTSRDVDPDAPNGRWPDGTPKADGE